MRHYYQITNYDKEKMLRLPKNQEHEDIYKESRFFLPNQFIDVFTINILSEIFDNKAELNVGLNDIRIDYQLSGDEILKLAYYGITVTEFSPKKRYIDSLKSRLADEVAELIKNGYYEESDKTYQLIKEL